MEEVSDWARIEVAVTNRQTMTINTTRILNLWSLTSASKESVQGCFMIALSQRSTVYTFCYNVVNRKGDEFVDNVDQPIRILFDRPRIKDKNGAQVLSHETGNA